MIVRSELLFGRLNVSTRPYRGLQHRYEGFGTFGDTFAFFVVFDV